MARYRLTTISLIKVPLPFRQEMILSVIVLLETIVFYASYKDKNAKHSCLDRDFPKYSFKQLNNLLILCAKLRCQVIISIIIIQLYIK